MPTANAPCFEGRALWFGMGMGGHLAPRGAGVGYERVLCLHQTRDDEYSAEEDSKPVTSTCVS